MANWTKIAAGVYETTDRRFQAFKHENGFWLLMMRNEDVIGNWEWCQSFATLRDAKNSAAFIAG